MAERTSRPPEHQGSEPARKPTQGAEAPNPYSQAGLLALQRSAGNAVVTRALARQKSPTNPPVGPTMGGETVQRLYVGPITVQRVAHKTGAEVDTYALASPFLKTYVKSKVDANTKADGHVHIHDAAAFKTVCVAHYMSRHNAATGANYTKAEAEAEEPRTNAFRDGSEIHLHTDRGEVGTAIHEGMHLYSHDTYKSTVGFAANEGTTELFARVIYTENSITRGAYYENELASVRKLCAASSKEKVADGYFKGDLVALKADANAKGAGTWDKWVGFMKARRFTDADALF